MLCVRPSCSTTGMQPPCRPPQSTHAQFAQPHPEEATATFTPSPSSATTAPTCRQLQWSLTHAPGAAVLEEPAGKLVSYSHGVWPQGERPGHWGRIVAPCIHIRKCLSPVICGGWWRIVCSARPGRRTEHQQQRHRRCRPHAAWLHGAACRQMGIGVHEHTRGVWDCRDGFGSLEGVGH